MNKTILFPKRNIGVVIIDIDNHNTDIHFHPRFRILQEGDSNFSPTTPPMIIMTHSTCGRVIASRNQIMLKISVPAVPIPVQMA